MSSPLSTPPATPSRPTDRLLSPPANIQRDLSGLLQGVEFPTDNQDILATTIQLRDVIPTGGLGSMVCVVDRPHLLEGHVLVVIGRSLRTPADPGPPNHGR